MKQINPLYIILLFVVSLIVVLFRLMDAKMQLHEAQNRFHETKLMVHDIVDLQRSWDSQKRTRNTLALILKSSLLRNTGVIQKYKRNEIELHCSSMDSKSASYLISRILNEPFSIKSMRIRRLSKDYASLDVEISL